MKVLSEESERARAESVEWRDSLVVECVEVHDTLREVTTITVDRNDKGDTLKVVQITDRDRIRSKADVRSKKEVVRVERDTVYVERKDSVLVQGDSLRSTFGRSQGENPRPSTLLLTLKWIFAVICAVVVLIMVVRIKAGA